MCLILAAVEKLHSVQTSNTSLTELTERAGVSEGPLTQGRRSALWTHFARKVTEETREWLVKGAPNQSNAFGHLLSTAQ